MTAHEPMTWYMGKMRPRAEVERLQAEEAAAAPPAPEPDSSSTDVSPIPEQLRECRFILVKARDKPAIERGWQETANYAYDDPRLLQHIAAGGNYGVMPAGGVCVLDADQTDRLMELGVLDRLLETFVVGLGARTGKPQFLSGPTRRRRSSSCGTETRRPRRPARSGTSRLCGPGCTHPSGGHMRSGMMPPWDPCRLEVQCRPCTGTDDHSRRFPDFEASRSPIPSARGDGLPDAPEPVRPGYRGD